MCVCVALWFAISDKHAVQVRPKPSLIMLIEKRAYWLPASLQIAAWLTQNYYKTLIKSKIHRNRYA